MECEGGTQSEAVFGCQGGSGQAEAGDDVLLCELSHATHLGSPKTTQESQISALTGGALA